MTHRNIDKTLLPSNDALGYDALYVPANPNAEGAWYDAFGITNQRFVLWIGNFALSDADAAAVRLAVRTGFGAHAAPAGAGTVLAAADALLGRQTAAAAPCATAIVGIVDCTDRTFTYVSAGHPAPLIRYHDGAVAALPADCLAGRDHPRAQVLVHLDDAAALLLYSKVLVQAASDPADVMSRLIRVLADERTAHCGSAAVRLTHRMLGSSRAHADVALLELALPRRPPPLDARAIAVGERVCWSVSWSFDTTGDTSNGARRAFLAFLRSTENGKTIDLPAAELVFGELLGNVVRHAPGPVEVTLDWTAEVPVLHVLDSGRGFRSRRARERLPVETFSETGRGLFIVTAYAAKFSVSNRKGRGTHACATLALV